MDKDKKKEKQQKKPLKGKVIKKAEIEAKKKVDAPAKKENTAEKESKSQGAGNKAQKGGKDKSGYIRQRFPGGGRPKRGGRGGKRDGDHSVLLLRRTAKTVEGGKRMRFSALVAWGNKKGKVGLALGKAPDPRSAIEKARKKARKEAVRVTVVNGTVPHQMEHRFKAAKIFIRPAPEGTGLIAGSSVRTVLDLAGVRNASAKIYGTNNKIANAYCIVEALQEMKRPDMMKNQQKSKVKQVSSVKRSQKSEDKPKKNIEPSKNK